MTKCARTGVLLGLGLLAVLLAGPAPADDDFPTMPATGQSATTGQPAGGPQAVPMNDSGAQIQPANPYGGPQETPGNVYGGPRETPGNIYGGPDENASAADSLPVTRMTARQLKAAGYRKCLLYDPATQTCRNFALTDEEREQAIQQGINVGLDGLQLQNTINQRIRQRYGQ